MTVFERPWGGVDDVWGSVMELEVQNLVEIEGS